MVDLGLSPFFLRGAQAVSSSVRTGTFLKDSSCWRGRFSPLRDLQTLQSDNPRLSRGLHSLAASRLGSRDFNACLPKHLRRLRLFLVMPPLGRCAAQNRRYSASYL